MITELATRLLLIAKNTWIQTLVINTLSVNDKPLTESGVFELRVFNQNFCTVISAKVFQKSSMIWGLRVDLDRV